MLFPNLRAELARNNLNEGDVAKLLFISPKSVSNKMGGRTDWKRTEMKLLKSRLGGLLDYLFEEGEKKGATQ